MALASANPHGYEGQVWGAHIVYTMVAKDKQKGKSTTYILLPFVCYIVGVMPYALASLVFIFSDINSITNISAKPDIINAMAMQN